jgi:hypothetical protein
MNRSEKMVTFAILPQLSQRLLKGAESCHTNPRAIFHAKTAANNSKHTETALIQGGRSFALCRADGNTNVRNRLKSLARIVKKSFLFRRLSSELGTCAFVLGTVQRALLSAGAKSLLNELLQVASDVKSQLLTVLRKEEYIALRHALARHAKTRMKYIDGYKPRRGRKYENPFSEETVVNVLYAENSKNLLFIT